MQNNAAGVLTFKKSKDMRDNKGSYNPSDDITTDDPKEQY